MDANEKRRYQRGEHFHIVAKISRDQKRWKKVSINNLSSGGLQLRSDEKYEIGETVWFDLTIQGFFSEFEINTKAEIKNDIARDGHHIYGVVFLDLSHDKKILIDENIKNDRPIGGDPYVNDV